MGEVADPERSEAERLNNNASLPLAVDLDGTLLRTDTLYEAIAANLRIAPVRTIGALLSAYKGRSTLKARLCDIGLPDVSTLPINEPFFEYLKAEKASGRCLHLATAADERIAIAVADRVGLFDSVEGSRPGRNLKAAEKRAALAARFPGGFVYAGDSRADLEVWKGADAAVFVDAAPDLREAALAAGAREEATFRAPAGSVLKEWRKALRLHQWSKNFLIFVPLMLAHLYDQPEAIVRIVCAFFIMGLVASGTYLVNDLADLVSDRRHRTKKDRPFAAGRLPVRDGLLAAPLLIAGGALAAFGLNPWFGVILLAYLSATLAYSFGLKRIAMLDVFILGFLYCLRILMGVAILGISLSPWLISFAFFFFFAMSLAKRHVELVGVADRRSRELVSGRGYAPADAPLTLVTGVSMTAASILVLVLYLTEEAFPSGAYAHPDYLWAAPALVLLWTQRIWLLAHRGELDDDPVAFAVKDRISILLGLVLLMFFLLATL